MDLGKIEKNWNLSVDELEWALSIAQILRLLHALELENTSYRSGSSVTRKNVLENNPSIILCAIELHVAAAFIVAW